MPHNIPSRYFFLFFFFVVLIIPVLAEKKDKNLVDKRIAGTMEYGIIEPDPLPRRPIPDHHAKSLEVPVFHYYSNDNQLSGFDISHYQGRINWDDLFSDPNAGFLYIKASEGGALKDNMYDTYLHEAKRVGFKVGTYHFFRATSTPHEQIRNFMSVVDISYQDLLPIIDVEVIGRGISNYVFHERLMEFLVLVEKAFGKKPLIYTGQNFYNKNFAGGRYKDYKFMIACYTDDQPKLSDNSDYLIWQYTGHGKAKGVRGYIDISKFVNGHTLSEIEY